MTETTAALDAPGISARFAGVFSGGPEGIWTAPGRVNIIGEHTDYNEGFVLPFAINLAASVAVRRRPDRSVRLCSTLDGTVVEASLDGLAPGAVQGWAAYPLGVLWALSERGVDLSGLDLLLDSQVPLGAGLSSSAAVECAVALAASDLADGPALSRADLVLVGQRAENEFVGAPTGILDQSASLLGSEGHALFLDCRSRHSEPVPFLLAEHGLVVLVIDTRVSHSHATGGYAARRASCELGARLLDVAALRDVSPSDLPAAQAWLDDETFRRVRHIVTENARVLETVEVLRTGSPAGIAGILDASHASMRDDFEISCPELDLAVEAARAGGALGARMVGGGFGGSAIALVPAALAGKVEAGVTAAFAAAGYREPAVFAVTPGPGARRTA